MVLRLLLFAGLAVGLITPLNAQAVNVTRIRDLSFLRLNTGIDKTVDPLSFSSAEFFLESQQRLEITLEFRLPEYLRGGGFNPFNADSIPLEFSPASAAYSPFETPIGAQFFDPNLPYTTLINPSTQKGYVWLGGTARPGFNQRAGVYRAVVLLVLSTVSNQ